MLVMLVSDGSMDGTKTATAAELGTRVVHPDHFEILLNNLQPAKPRAARATSPAAGTQYRPGDVAGLDVALRGLSLVGTDEQTLAVPVVVFDGLYEFYRRSLLLCREPA